MDAGFDPDPASVAADDVLRNERLGMIVHAQTLQEMSRETRAASQEIVARCVEARISRDQRRSER